MNMEEENLFNLNQLFGKWKFSQEKQRWVKEHNSIIQGQYQMFRTSNIFNKYGQGWVVCKPSISSLDKYEQYFAIKTSGYPWEGGDIIYNDILINVPEDLNVLITQIINGSSSSSSSSSSDSSIKNINIDGLKDKITINSSLVINGLDNDIIIFDL